MEKIKSYFESFEKNKGDKKRIGQISKEFIDKFIVDTKSPIIIYGAGVITVFELLRMLKIFDIVPVAIIDSDENKWGKYISNIRVMSISEANSMYGEDVKVFVAVRGRKYDMIEINNNLKKLGYKNIVQCSEWLRFREILGLNDYNLMNDKNDKDIINNFDSIEWLYYTLEDEYSRKTLEEIVHSRLIPFEHEYKYYETSYFEDGLFSKKAFEYVVDCGAYRGDTLKEFLNMDKNTNCLKGYYAFEMDPINIKFLKNMIDNNYKVFKQNIEVYPFAISNTNGEVNIYANGSTGTHISSDGNLKISSVKLDDCLKDKMISLIKMDIEGAEYLALEGAKMIIKKHRPVLVISLYHRNRDLWEIPKFIHSLVDSYKGILMHEGLFDYIYFAIPKDKYL